MQLDATLSSWSHQEVTYYTSNKSINHAGVVCSTPRAAIRRFVHEVERDEMTRPYRLKRWATFALTLRIIGFLRSLKVQERGGFSPCNIEVYDKSQIMRRRSIQTCFRHILCSLSGMKVSWLTVRYLTAELCVDSWVYKFLPSDKAIFFSKSGNLSGIGEQSFS